MIIKKVFLSPRSNFIDALYKHTITLMIFFTNRLTFLYQEVIKVCGFRKLAVRSAPIVILGGDASYEFNKSQPIRELHFIKKKKDDVLLVKVKMAAEI